ncbi:PQQ-dependent sugar dehydrogenase [Sphingomonas sp. R-74633]|uniref:PQQ-dependent sugar dehydrogenase n=1 Tax=Sphingomonas sp. R-74633 TaxID=2751188 RepID=UPI0015D3691A|nr:PQQ-dependent sugar dehydrogenase [Sphingomonas sp. R-74633]NYT41365.1 PQQ-dependent sugar dehydrogenase [Sphingomonas sp. R-74633]
MRSHFRMALPALALLAACNSSGVSAQQSATPAATGDMPFNMTQVADFDTPWAMAFLPDGRMLVTEKAGKILLVSADGARQQTIATVDVAFQGQGGLLDVIPAPDFAKSHLVYYTYAEPRPEGSSLAMARATFVDGATPALTNLQVLWRAGADGKGGQFGAIIAFAPDGKSLFLTSGERQRFTPAQDPNQALGKILHLTLDGKPAPGNPWAGKTGTATVTVTDPPKNTEIAKTAPTRVQQVEGTNLVPAETWTLGHRNPYGLVFDTAGRLWENEMGPKGGDEINLIRKGQNYGWPNASNGDNYDGTPIPDHKAGDGYAAPAVFWNPSISPGGMIYYSGKLFPAWKGSLLVGALSGRGLIRVALDGDKANKAEQWDLNMRVRDVVQGPDGAVWLLEDAGKTNGRLFKLTPKR